MYYQKSIEETLKETHTTVEGLSSQEASHRQAKYGKNELAEKKKESPFLISRFTCYYFNYCSDYFWFKWTAGKYFCYCGSDYCQCDFRNCSDIKS